MPVRGLQSRRERSYAWQVMTRERVPSEPVPWVASWAHEGWRCVCVVCTWGEGFLLAFLGLGRFGGEGFGVDDDDAGKVLFRSMQFCLLGRLMCASGGLVIDGFR